jgi:predicted short-subunit dehydrogenase-like oxidoreductase (DUF2520 family)
MNDIPPSPAVAVIGSGRLGRALATALGAPAPLGRGEAPPPGSGAVILAVPDGAVAALAASLPPGPPLGHCAGALGLDVLAPHRERFSLHPLMTLTPGSDGAELRGAGAAIAGSTPEARLLAAALARRAGLEPFAVDEADRALYHAAASIASNFLVTLEAIAEALFAAVGVDRRHAARLAQASLDNWAALGGRGALTGPVARGDRATVARQRDAIAGRAPAALAVFDALTEATRELAAA